MLKRNSGFLNNILSLPLDAQIIDVTLLNPYQAPHLPGAKETILDVRCHDQKGAHYIVEMQIIAKAFFDKRALYYASRAYTHQLESGMDYDCLKPFIFLGILNFEFTEGSHYLSTHCIQDIITQEKALHDFQFTFAELPKFNKTENELVTVEEKWLYFLKNAHQLETIPAVIHEAALREAFEVLNRLNWDKASLEMYDYRGIQATDERMRVQYGYTKGLELGEEKGIKRGEIALLIKLLSKRFGILSTVYQEQLEQATPAQLTLWEDRLLDAKTLEEVFT